VSSVASTGNEAGQSHAYTEQGVSWGEKKTKKKNTDDSHRCFVQLHFIYFKYL